MLESRYSGHSTAALPEKILDTTSYSEVKISATSKRNFLKKLQPRVVTTLDVSCALIIGTSI
jgi:hypothetical protein